MSLKLLLNTLTKDESDEDTVKRNNHTVLSRKPLLASKSQLTGEFHTFFLTIDY